MHYMIIKGKTMVFSSKYWYLGVPDATFPKRQILGRRDLGCLNPSDDQDETVDAWVSWLVTCFFLWGVKYFWNMLELLENIATLDVSTCPGRKFLLYR